MFRFKTALAIGAAVLVSGCTSYCKKMDADACTDAGNETLGQEPDMGMKILTEACEALRARRACAIVGLVLVGAAQHIKVEPNRAKAMPFLEKGCADAPEPFRQKQRHGADSMAGNACYTLASLHEFMAGVPENEPRARDLASRACKQHGAQAACNWLTSIRIAYAGPTGLSSDEAGQVIMKIPPEDQLRERAKPLPGLCDKGEAEACFTLGWMQNRGAGTKWDPAAALTSFEKGCSVGHAKSCNNVGVMALYGAGQTRDQQKAKTFFAKARDLGYSAAELNLGMVDSFAGFDGRLRR